MTLVKSNLTSIKCCIVGSCGVGKTSIIKKHLDKNNINTETTLGAIFWTIEHHLNNGNSFKIDFWDTAGQERYNSLIPMYSRNSNIIIIGVGKNDGNSIYTLAQDTILPYIKETDDYMLRDELNVVDRDVYFYDTAGNYVSKVNLTAGFNNSLIESIINEILNES